MRYVEIILIGLCLLMLALKGLSIPHAGTGLSLFSLFLAIFYLTSKLHIFRDKQFDVGITLITGFILFISVLILLMFLNHWLYPMFPAFFVLLIIQSVWFLILILLKKPCSKELSIRIGVTAAIFFLALLDVFLKTYL